MGSLEDGAKERDIHIGGYFLPSGQPSLLFPVCSCPKNLLAEDLHSYLQSDWVVAKVQTEQT